MRVNWAKHSIRGDGMTDISPSYDISAETIEELRQLMKEDVTDVALIFKALSDPLRIGILKALNVSDLCVCVFIDLTDLKYPLMSYHLKQLKDAKLVDYDKRGKFLVYRLTELGRKALAAIDELKSSL